VLNESKAIRIFGSQRTDEGLESGKIADAVKARVLQEERPAGESGRDVKEWTRSCMSRNWMVKLSSSSNVP
jgi:hypothetical protein